MKGNKYWNTFWTERDTEFYWSGHKDGFVIGIILTATLIGDGFIFVKWIKEQMIQKEES